MKKSRGLIKKDLIIIIAGIILLVIIFLLSYLLPKESKEDKAIKEVKIILNDSNYSIGDKIKLNIENNLDDSVCFSSCYPYYYIAKNNGKWKDYRYQECKKENLAYSCISSNEKKAFEIDVPQVNAGEHRIVLPACIGCVLNDLFIENNRFYSDIFKIK